MRPLRVVLLGILTLAAPALVACGPSSTSTKTPPTHPPGPPVTLSITPAGNTTSLPVSTEVGLTVGHGTVSAVTMTKSDGTSVSGAFRADDSSWVPSQPLAYGSSYTAVVQARSTDGQHVVTRSTRFTTMSQPGNQVYYGMYAQDGVTYGVGMPLVLEFDPPIPAANRAGIQNRLFVTTNPAQPGVWHWASDGQQVWYRPPVYWQTGTTISFRAALQGVSFGNGSYGDQDRSATITIGNKVSMLIDNKTKSMYVYQDDKLTRTIPVSLGKPSTPSSSGTMVTMSHDYSTIFDVPGEYRVQVYYAMRLTWGGEFIHAAPWSVSDQGVDNVSHGCVNVSDENAKWLYGITHIGDPVTVQGTEVKLVDGNGWTAWNESWPEYVAGSALPVPAALANWTPQQGAPAQAGSSTKSPAPAPTR
jgi:lipoprotein-anchoring transpeptidase ErfK/SrfK